MNKLPKTYGIIPARYESSRFPGKALADIQVKPMFWHVFDRARQCSAINTVVLATDDNRIYTVAKDLAVPVLMTDPNHPSGTDRILEAAEMLHVQDDDVVVNIQGDEPLLVPDMLSELLHPFTDSTTQVTTLAKQISIAESQNPDRVKVVTDKHGQALYFSRSPIPFDRKESKPDYKGHVGIYAFRMNTLRQFQKLGPSFLESLEYLEQLRLLENGIPIRVIMTEYDCQGVDTPADLELVLKKLLKDTHHET